MSKHIQLCIITGQPLANLIPIIQLQPAVVALVVSADMKNNGKANAFKKLLLSIGYSNECLIEFVNVPDAKYYDIEFKALEIMEELKDKFPGDEIYYNLTGGNKLMALAFFSQINEPSSNATIFYVDTSHNIIEFLKPNNRESIVFEQCLDVKNYLKSYGKTYRSAQCDSVDFEGSVNARKNLTLWIAKNINELKDAIGCLNGAAKKALDREGKRLVENLQILPFYPKRAYKDLLKRSMENDIFSWSEEEENKIYFNDVAGAKYIGGGWLEEYAWLVAVELGLHDVKMGVQITDDINPKSNVRNELDLVIVHNNKMLLVEAKTMVFGNDHAKDSNVINQLDSLGKNAGGIFCGRLLLSAKPLDHVTQNNRAVNVEDRAKSQDIDTLAEERILELEQYIKKWAANK